MGKHIGRRTVDEFSPILWVAAAFHKSAQKQVADRRGRIHAADVVYRRSGRRAFIKEDREDFEPCIADITLLFFRRLFHHGVFRVRRDGKDCLSIGPDECEASAFYTCCERIKGGSEVCFAAEE